MKITYYLEVISSWCHWAEPTWAELKARYAGKAEFEWKIALMNPGDFPASREQTDWFYRRSGTIVRSPYMLHSGWFQPELAGHYEAANWVAEAARSLGVTDDRARLAISHAAVREGKNVGTLEVAVAAAAQACGLKPEDLRSAAESDAIKTRVAATTAEFHALKITQRPAFVLEDAIGDRAVFSGLVTLAPLTATIDAMLNDVAAYRTHEAHFGKPCA